MHANIKVVIIGAAVAGVLAASSTVALAAATGGMGSSSVGTAHGPFGGSASRYSSSCSVPSLPGSVVDVALTDMGG